MSTAGFVAEGATLYYETSDCSGTAYDFGGYDYFANGLQVVSLTEAYYPARPFATRTVNSRRIIGGACTQATNTNTYGVAVSVDLSSFGFVPPFRHVR